MYFAPHGNRHRWATWLASAILAIAGLGSPVFAQAAEIPLARVNAAQLLDAGTMERATQTGTAWTAEVVRPVVARSKPDRDADARVTLHPYGVSVHPTTLLATRGFRDRYNHDWVQVQLNIRPNQSSGWIPADAVLLTPITVRVIVHLASRRLDVFQDERNVLSVPTGIGRTATPTPTGRFAVDDMWTTDAATRPIYGRFVLSLTAHSNVLMRFDGGEGRIAIHGGGAANRVGARSSFGCLIVSAATLQRLWRLVRPGTPVTVLAD